jgi:hypothetical protein
MIDLIFRRPIFLLAIVVMAQVMLLAYQIKGVGRDRGENCGSAAEHVAGFADQR